MDVRPLVIADAQVTELISQAKVRSTTQRHRPSPLPCLMRRIATNGSICRAQPTPNRGCVVAAIPEHTVWPPSRSPPFAVQRGNRIDQRQGFLRVVAIRAGETYGERHASPVANQMTLAPTLGSVRGIRPGLVAPAHCADGAAIDNSQRPINLLVTPEPIEQREVHQIPSAGLLPIAHPPPARHPRSAPEFLRQHLPGYATAKNEDNAGETRSIRYAWPSTPWPSRWNRQERFDEIPQRIWEQRGGHTRPRYRVATG